MDRLNPSQLAIYSLVRKFVERQEIVFHAMIELYPRLMARSGSVSPERIRELSTLPVKFVGEWGEDKEWDYFLHGVGCRLIHKLTGERIEWDASNTKRFDGYWFFKWVEWYMTQTDDIEESFKVIRSLNSDSLQGFIADTLSQLQGLGMLVRVNSTYANPKYIVD